MDSNYSVIPKSSFIELERQLPKSTDPQFSPVYTLKPLTGGDGDEGDENLVVHGEDFPLVVDYKPIDAGSGIPGAVFNLSTSIIGAGIMALPATMKVLGLLLGSFLIVAMGILSEVSVEMLVRYSDFLKASSYGDSVESVLGLTGRVVSEICIVVNNAGILVVYLIIIGDVMSGSPHHEGIFEQLFGDVVWDDRRLVIFVVLVLFLAPLCFLNKIDSLSLTSAASIALAVVFVAVSCVIAAVKLVEGQFGTPRLGPDFGSEKAILDLLVVVPIMTNAYICHFNVQPIYNELKGRSPQKMNRVGRITTILCVAIYASTAISGYLLFGDDTESDVLTNFDRNLGIRFSSALNYIVRIGYVLHLILVFPVIHFSLRQTVDALVFKGRAPLTECQRRSIVLTVLLMALIYLGSTIIPNIWVAFKFTGATTAVSLGFIFPSLIALRLDKQGQRLDYWGKILSWFMLVMAVLVGIIGVAGNIYSIEGSKG